MSWSDAFWMLFLLEVAVPFVVVAFAALLFILLINLKRK